MMLLSHSYETERLPAGAGRISDVLFQVLKYDVLCDGAVGGREVPPAPKPAAPIALADMWELALHLVRRTALHL